MRSVALLLVTRSPTNHTANKPERATVWLCVALWALVALFAPLRVARAGSSWPWSARSEPSQQPHPSVARIIVQERDGTAQGSGTLVDVRDQYGLVVTNWHVVRDASGSIQVVFPNGYRTAARVLRVDEDWDLAALLIWRPSVNPVPLASRAPQPGEPLTIAGYGPGPYRAATGRCTQYVAPSGHHPFEMVEVSVPAREGDSGGPIFNTQGELAGVLFGSGGGTTSGSYSRRVLQFLQTAWPLPIGADRPTQIAANPSLPTTQDLQPLPARSKAATIQGTATLLPPIEDGPEKIASALPLPEEPSAQLETAHAHGGGLNFHDIAGNTAFDQVKTVLALVGIFSIIFQLTKKPKPRSE